MKALGIGAVKLPADAKHAVVVLDGAFSGAASCSPPNPRPDRSMDAADLPMQQGARRRRWAELLRLVLQVEVEVCPRCAGAMAIVAFVTEPRAVRRILAWLELRDIDARAGPWADAVAGA